MGGGDAAEGRNPLAGSGRLLGGTLDPFAAWLVLRGIKTLAVRMEGAQPEAMAVAQVESHPSVSRVFYPGLPSHPQHDWLHGK